MSRRRFGVELAVPPVRPRYRNVMNPRRPANPNAKNKAPRIVPHDARLAL
jgi:hypothetical protein